MANDLRRKRATAALFSLIVAWLLGFAGFLAGTYLWDHFGPPASDPDDTVAQLCGLLIGGAMAVGGFAGLLWIFWPRTMPKASRVVSTPD
jgi:hypothetical protein